MIFFLIILIVLLILSIVSWKKREEEVAIVAVITLITLSLVFLGLIVEKRALKGEITDIRENPQYYSIYDKHDINKKIQSAKRYHGSIFSFYNGFDLSYIEEV